MFDVKTVQHIAYREEFYELVVYLEERDHVPADEG